LSYHILNCIINCDKVALTASLLYNKFKDWKSMTQPDLPSRLHSLLHTLHHIGIDQGSFRQVASEYQENRSSLLATQLRALGRSAITAKGVVPEQYMSGAPISIEVIEPPLPEALLGAMALLGTSEGRLQSLEPHVH
jgi:hypothetical protein